MTVSGHWSLVFRLSSLVFSLWSFVFARDQRQETRDQRLETRDQRPKTACVSHARAAVCLAAISMLGVDPAAAQSPFSPPSSSPPPTYNQLRVIAPAAPGGGWDQTARVMQQVLQ